MLNPKTSWMVVGPGRFCQFSVRRFHCTMLGLLCVLVRVSVAELKHQDQHQVEKENVYLAYVSIFLFIIEGTQAGQEHGRRS